METAYWVQYIFVRKNNIYVNFVQVGISNGFNCYQEHNKNILFLIVLLSNSSAWNEQISCSVVWENCKLTWISFSSERRTSGGSVQTVSVSFSLGGEQHLGLWTLHRPPPLPCWGILSTYVTMMNTKSFHYLSFWAICVSFLYYKEVFLSCDTGRASL